VRKVGRPKKSKKDRRGNVLRIRLTATERHIIDVAAQKNHLDTSTWARSIILKEAEKNT